MTDLQKVILTIPEIEAALKEYRAVPKTISDARLREYIAIMQKQHEKSQRVILADVSRQLQELTNEWGKMSYENLLLL